MSNFDLNSIEGTLERMISEGVFPKERALLLKNKLPEDIEKSKYIIYNLTVHAGIGVFFAFDVIPIPLGTISRFSWVLGNRIYYTIKRNNERKEVHSLSVLLVSAIPWIGYIAYTIPLKKQGEDLCYLYANHLTYSKKGKSLKDYLESKPKFIKKPLTKLLIPRNLNAADFK